MLISSVFIDYGVEWEHAWNNHTQRWVGPEREEDFVSAKEANERTGPVLKHLVSGDLRKTVNDRYLFTGCFYEATDDDMEGENFTKPNPAWTNMTDDEIMETYADDGHRFSRQPDYYRHHNSRSHWPCTVLLPEAEAGEYTVRIHMMPMRGTYRKREIVRTAWHRNDVPRILTNYPQSSIHYFVRPTATDQMLPQAFRHPMGFPDELFPDQWRRRQID
jgi:hypothetical protein